MNEHYLHFLWKNKRLPLHQLQTIDGEKMEILHVGFYNPDSGPDFFNGQIRIDQVTHSGNIEMHVRSSDWNLHRHQHDPAYFNVILHVVYEHDQLIFIEGIPIPTVELKALIDWKHYDWFNRYYKKNTMIICETFLKQLPQAVIWNQVERAVFQRMARKSDELNTLFRERKMSFKEVLFHAISKAFGMKVNQLPFQELATGIPVEKFIRSSRKQKLAIVFGVGGFLEKSAPVIYHRELKEEWDFQKFKLKLYAGNQVGWKFKGCRPGGFPTQRLAQFAAFVHEMDWTSAIWYLPAKSLLRILQESLLKPADTYWTTHFDFGKEKKSCSGMSIATANTIITNSVVPFLWWLTDNLSDETYRNRAFELLESLPAEQNGKIALWKSMGIKPKNALESQGLIELTNEFCLKKACLNCTIGNAVLKGEIKNNQPVLGKFRKRSALMDWS
ncbi:DUF2851 family protein [Fluviicola sp.]|jgi:hypothetical protein|uniref:DUF2851 family protein n=1 Tax=Fluviicola sp. TaxID=1917219 RepID=UPI00281D0071|nr:DUF2851 family protein [Fluviicola sp.]MDR0802387.1 DUF2851 family protein [Fluviicola sp.]